MQIRTVATNEGSLTRRASLTFINNILQQGARLIVGFSVTPIVIRGLGAELYGAWVMIQHTVGYLALSDLRAMGTLKFTLAVRQHRNDVEEKRRQIGASVLVWACMLPLILLAGVAIIFASPFFILTATKHTSVVRVAMAIAVLSFSLDRILSLPANVLRGVNMEYKAMGLNATVTALIGFLTALAIWCGLGLVGVAAASMLGIMISSSVRFFVAKQVIPWFGAARPTKEEFLGFTKLSGWLLLSSIGGLLLSSGDVLLIGIILGPSSAAIYATTGAILRLIQEPVGQLLSSGAPGVADICGRRDWLRLENVRIEMHLIAITTLTVVGVCVIALNRSFLDLWVGKDFYDGNLTNLFLVLISFQKALLRVDGIVVDSMLEFRRKAFAMIIAGAVIVILGGSMVYALGIVGMAIGVFLSLSSLLIYLLTIIKHRTGADLKNYIKTILRPLITTALLFSLAFGLSQKLSLSSWFTLVATALILTLLTGIVMWVIGLNSEQRHKLAQRVILSTAVIRTGET
jgi:O-antigen/teichoic acid export membrane protein